MQAREVEFEVLNQILVSLTAPTGNLRAVQILLGHTKIESTVRYLGVDIEDTLAP